MQDVEQGCFYYGKEVRVKQFLRINIGNTFLHRYIISNKPHCEKNGHLLKIVKSCRV